MVAMYSYYEKENNEVLKFHMNKFLFWNKHLVLLGATPWSFKIK